MYLKSYKELIVWQKSIQLVKEAYLLTNKFPASEIYGITSQLRRAVVSIPSNIAEGYGRNSHNEYRQYYSVAYGSALEFETQIIISKELGLAPVQEFGKVENLLIEVLKMLNTMTHNMKKLDAKR